MENKIPLMLLGARQVGKTYVLTEFCKNNYKNFIYINLLERNDIVDLYNTNINADEKFIKLCLMIGSNIEDNDTILFIDEIQESESLISSLKYFSEQHPNSNIVCAGSLLGVKLKRGKFSFPVGKVYILKMYPLNFEEFLYAQNENMLVDEIRKCFNENVPLLDIFHQKCITIYRNYLCTGGMPKIVNDYISNQKDLSKLDSKIISSIIESYFSDMNRYVISSSESLKIEKLYNGIPYQLGNESNKFQISKIDSYAKTREYELPISWLEASNLILPCYSVTLPEIPLRGFVNESVVKYYLSDVGLLGKMLNISFIDIIMNNVSLYKGVITENYVASEFISYEKDLYYINKNRELEIDFLLYTKEGIIPVEVKSSDNTRSKSLEKYNILYKPKYMIRISTKNFGYVNNIKSVPLYAVFCLRDI